MADPAHSNAVVMLQTVHENMANLTFREMKKAVLARKVQSRMGNPTEDNFIDLVIKGTLTNWPVIPVYIANARHMFGPARPWVKSNTVQRKLVRVEL